MKTLFLASLVYFFIIVNLHGLWIQGTIDENAIVQENDVDDGPDNIHLWDRTGPMNGDFIGHNFDFSGVGTSGNFWGTLISDTYFLSANHAHPGVNSSLTFYSTDEFGDPVSESIEVVGGQRIGGTDLWLGQLDHAPTIDVISYKILKAKDSVADFVGLGEHGSPGDQQPARLDLDPDLNSNVLFLVGQGGSGGDEIRVGLNVATAFTSSDDASPGGDTDTLSYEFNTSPIENNVFTEYEAFFKSGDSGGPTFWVDYSGQMTLVGIHSYTTGGNGSGAPFYAGDSYDALPGQYESAIKAIDGDAEFVAVPEASLYVLALGGLSGFWTLIRRKRAGGLSH